MVNLRALIEEIDAKLLDLLKQRTDLSRQIGLLKKAEGLPIHDPLREKEHLEALTLLAKQKELDPLKVAELFTLLMQQSKDEQQKI